MQGTLTPKAETESSLKADALEVLQAAWKAIRRMEPVSDDPAEAKAAERALAFVDKAFAELESPNCPFATQPFCCAALRLTTTENDHPLRTQKSHATSPESYIANFRHPEW